MTVDPIIPTSLWLALAIAAAALIVWYALRRPSILTRLRWAAVIALMSASLLLVLLILLNPTRVTAVPPPAGKPLLTILVDSSASMAINDAPGDRSRYEAACDSAAAFSKALDWQFDVRIRPFAGGAVTKDTELSKQKPTGQITDLGAGIADDLDPARPQGQAVLLLSDGGHNAGSFDAVADAVSSATALDAPIYTRTFGGARGGLNLSVDLHSTQELAFIGQQVPVGVTVSQRGARGATATVSLLDDGNVLEKKSVDIIGESAEVQFWVSQPKAGPHPYEVRVDPLPRELTQSDNTATYLLRVIDKPVHVLMLEGKPYWDAKFVIRTLSSAPAVELESIVRVADGRLMQRTVTRENPTTKPGAPSPEDPRSEKWKIISSAADVLANPENLKQYQVIVLGRDVEPFLTDAGVANIQNWIARDGGSLVCYRGSPVAQVNQALAKLLPVKWRSTPESRFRPQLTSAGQDLHWFASTPGTDEQSQFLNLPTLSTAEQVDRAKPAATVLATAETGDSSSTPVVVYQQYGAGRAVVIEGAGMWRWAFLPPQFQQRDVVYTKLWHSLLRWLSSSDRLLPGQTAMLRSDKVVFDTIEPATATLLLDAQPGSGKSPAVELTLDGSSGKPAQFSASELPGSPGTFKVAFGRLPEGRYQAKLAGDVTDVAAHTVFNVRTSGQEEREPEARPDRMAWIATHSGGAVLDSDDPSRISREFAQHMQASRPPQFERRTAWDRPWVLLLVVALWTCSWAVRRSGGLI